MNGGIVNCWQKLEQRVRRNRIDLKCAGDEKMNGMARLLFIRVRIVDQTDLSRRRGLSRRRFFGARDVVVHGKDGRGASLGGS